MNRAIFFSFGLIFCASLRAQEKVYISKEIDVHPPAFTEKTDSLKIKSLAASTGFYLRAGGPVSSSGLSIRSAAPAHTEISWNSLPLASPLIGQADASLISPLMLRQGKIRAGGDSETGFCGAFGGSLLLGEASPENGHKAEGGIAAGSFGQLEQWASMHVGGKNSLAGLRCWNSSGKWDYPIRIGNFSTRMQHQSRKFYGLEGSATLEYRKNQFLDGGIWIQESDRQLPAVLFQEQKGSRQLDAGQRFFLRQRIIKPGFTFLQLIGFSRDELHFQDPASQTDSKARSLGFFYRTEGRLRIKSAPLHLSGHLSRQTANSGQGNGILTLNRSGLRAATELNILRDFIHFQPGLNAEFFLFPDSRRSDFFLLPSARMEFRYSNKQNLSLSWNARSRCPGLNDLYWPMAGNPNLRAERGFTASADWNCHFPITNPLDISLGSSLFATRISNYILWLPKGAFWSPRNIGKAEIEGIQLKAGGRYSGKKGRGFSLQSDVQLSRQRMGILQNGRMEKSPMPFQPGIQASLELKIERPGFALWLRQMHQGKRLTGFAEGKELDAYATMDTGLEWTIRISRLNLRLSADANNVWNVSYYLIPGFPMPGRNFRLACSLLI